MVANNDTEAFEHSYKARREINKKANEIKSKGVLIDVALMFEKFFIPFTILSGLATFYSMNVILMSSNEVSHDPVPSIFIYIISILIAVTVEAFKHAILKWMFAKQDMITKVLSIVLSVVVFGGAAYSHVIGGSAFITARASRTLNKNVEYSKEMDIKASNMQQSLVDSISEASKALNNGTMSDDKDSASTVNIIKETLTSVNFGVSDTTLKLMTEQREKDIALISDSAENTVAILIAFELFILFSFVAKFIIVRNADSFDDADKVLDALDQKVEESKHVLFASVASYANNTIKEMGNFLATQNDNNKVNNFVKQDDNKAIEFKQYKPKAEDKKSLPILHPDEEEKQDKLKALYNEVNVIWDADGRSFFYFRNWIICEGSDLSIELTGEPTDGFTREVFHKLTTRNTFEITQPIACDSHVKDWVSIVYDIKQQKEDNGFKEFKKKAKKPIEPEVLNVEETKEYDEKQKDRLDDVKNEKTLINLDKFSDIEKIAINSIWKNGDIETGDKLPSKKTVLKTIKSSLIKKSIEVAKTKVGEISVNYTMDDLGRFYDKLIELQYIVKISGNSPIGHYVATAELK